MVIYCWRIIGMNLKEERLSYDITQQRAAEIVGIPLRTYVRYEQDDNYGDGLKRKVIQETLRATCAISEDNGVLTIDAIKTIINDLLEKEYKGKVEFCYLFGSYAKGYAKADSDVDLCISTQITGFEYFGLVESLRESLHKKVDVLRIIDLKNNIELVIEIMKDGIRIYG